MRKRVDARCGFFTTRRRISPLIVSAYAKLSTPRGGHRRRAFLGFGSAKNLLDEARVQRVAGPVRGDLADDRTADQGEVADQVEDLVADELVAEAERSVHDAAVVEDDAVLDRAAARQAGRAQLLDVVHEAERARRRDLLEEVVVMEVELRATACRSSDGRSRSCT